VKFFVKIKLVKDNNIAPDEFRFISIKQQKDITELYK